MDEYGCEETEKQREKIEEKRETGSFGYLGTLLRDMSRKSHEWDIMFVIQMEWDWLHLLKVFKMKEKDSSWVKDFHINWYINQFLTTQGSEKFI